MQMVIGISVINTRTLGLETAVTNVSVFLFTWLKYEKSTVQISISGVIP